MTHNAVMMNIITLARYRVRVPVSRQYVSDRVSIIETESSDIEKRAGPINWVQAKVTHIDSLSDAPFDKIHNLYD